jgi:hypothetical protein
MAALPNDMTTAVQHASTSINVALHAFNSSDSLMGRIKTDKEVQAAAAWLELVL